MRKSLEVFLLFLRFGFTGFGGPLAHTALFEEECVRKRGWLSRERFLERLSLSQMIPGPNSSELAMHIGYERAGWPGFVLAGLGFIVPAVVMVSILGELYVRAGGFGGIGVWVWGTKPVVSAIIVVMLVRTANQVFRPWTSLVPALFGFLLIILGAPTLTGLFGAAGMFLLFFRRLPVHACAAFLLSLPLLFPFEFAAYTLPSGAPTLVSLFTQMLYLGSIVIGSGYVLFSYYSAHIVDRLHWFDTHGLAMAIAAGQLTPGPLFASAAFFGQVRLGVLGAVACSVGIFLPAFVFSALSIPLARRMETSPWWRDTLLVMGALSVLLMGKESLHLLPLFLDGTSAYVMFAVALAVYARFRVNSSLLILLGAAAGAFIR